MADYRKAGTGAHRSAIPWNEGQPDPACAVQVPIV